VQRENKARARDEVALVNLLAHVAKDEAALKIASETAAEGKRLLTWAQARQREAREAKFGAARASSTANANAEGPVPDGADGDEPGSDAPAAAAGNPLSSSSSAAPVVNPSDDEKEGQNDDTHMETEDEELEREAKDTMAWAMQDYTVTTPGHRCAICQSVCPLNNILKTGPNCDPGHAIHATCAIDLIKHHLKAQRIEAGERRDREYPNWRTTDHCPMCKRSLISVDCRCAVCVAPRASNNSSAIT